MTPDLYGYLIVGVLALVNTFALCAWAGVYLVRAIYRMWR